MKQYEIWVTDKSNIPTDMKTYPYKYVNLCPQYIIGHHFLIIKSNGLFAMIER